MSRIFFGRGGKSNKHVNLYYLEDFEVGSISRSREFDAFFALAISLKITQKNEPLKIIK